MGDTAAAEAPALAPIEYRDAFGVRCVTARKHRSHRVDAQPRADAPSPPPRSLQQPCDMADDMVRDIIELARSKLGALANWRVEGDAALLALKEALDAKYLPSWTVAAGRHFGSRATHDAKHFISFYLGDLLVLIFRR